MTSTRFTGGAIVTGAARGIGRAVAEELAAAGWGVLLADRDTDALVSARDSLRAEGGRAEICAVDVRAADAGDRLVEACVGLVGPVRVLVNNAGVEIRRSFGETTGDDWDAVLDTNARAPYFIAQAVAAHMIQAGTPGRIVNIGSVEGMRAEAEWGTYCISKAALIMATRVMAIELAPFGITANVVNPGLIDTEMSAFASTEAGVLAAHLWHIPAGRIGRPAEVAAAVRFLASDEAGYVTGAVLEVDGGLSAQLWRVESPTRLATAHAHTGTEHGAIESRKRRTD